MQSCRRVHYLVVRVRSAQSQRGMLEAGWMKVPCAIGRSGVSRRKREGDGATPAGRWLLRSVLLRDDRVRPAIRVALRSRRLPGRGMKPRDGWCDAVADRNYNRLVAHPYPASAEQLWREDGLYDVVVVLGHNHHPRIRGLGSAIFLHCASDRFEPTAGCIGIRRSDLVRLLPALSPRTVCIVK